MRSFLKSVREEANIFTLAPNPKAALAAASVMLLAPKSTTSIGGTPVIFPNKSRFSSVMSSEAVSTAAIPVSSSTDCCIG